VWYAGGPGFFYGGHNRDGIPVAQGLYDSHGAGLGATPARDGVHCGGNMNIPSGGISDVERIEMQYPFLYFTRNFHLDGGGAGKFNGGTGSFRIYMIYGSGDCSVSYRPYSRLPEGVGLFGGNPAGIGGIRAVYQTAGASLLQRLKSGQYPIQPDQIESDNWGTVAHPAEIKGRVDLPEFTIVADFVAGGGGYGDPIERAPDAVAKDIRRGIVSPRIAEEIYGVVLSQNSITSDDTATLKRRQEIRQERIQESKPFSGQTSSLPDTVSSSTTWEEVLKFHEHLAIARAGKTEAIRCVRCGHLFCKKHDNYKLYAPRRERDLYDLAQRLVPSGESYLGGYLEYYCPGCATLLQVDGFCDAFPSSKEPLHDFYQEQ
jgi:acetone carboxylase gamma subunit